MLFSVRTLDESLFTTHVGSVGRHVVRIFAPHSVTCSVETSWFNRQNEPPFFSEDDVIDNDLILVWGKQKRIITGSDLLGRLLRGISIKEVKSN
jgi:hypothetical protein